MQPRTRLTPTWTTGWTPGVALAGLVLIALGAWAFTVALLGAKFSFSFDGTPAWTWSRRHWELSLLPGIVAAAGGLLMLLRSVAIARIGALAALAAGAWLVVGPFVLPVWAAGVGPLQPVGADDGKRALLWIGWFAGAGAVTAAVAGHGLGLLARRHLGTADTGSVLLPARGATGEPVTPVAAPLAAPVSERAAPVQQPAPAPASAPAPERERLPLP